LLPRTLAASGFAVSLTTSDPHCAINATLTSLLSHLGQPPDQPSTRVILHVGCGANATSEEREALGRLPRVTLNPKCVHVSAGDGSILLAHLLNVRLLATAPPQTLLLASADMRWIASGAEAAAARRVSSAIGAAWIELGAAVAAVAPRHRVSFDDAATRWAVGAAGRLVVQKHEGSFYPWDVVAAFHDGLCAAGAMPRLPARRAVHARPVLWLAPEETLLPSFAAARLNSSGPRAASLLQLDERLADGVTSRQ